MPQIRVLVVDDHAVVRQGLATLVASQADMECVGFAATGEAALQLLGSLRPDVTVLDWRLPDLGGAELLAAMRRIDSRVRVLVLSTFANERQVCDAMAAGARGYVLKEAPPAELMDVIRRVHGGAKHLSPELSSLVVDNRSRPALTDRELEVLQLMATGLRNKEVAGLLGISEHTVSVHSKSVLAKLEVHDRVAAVTTALRRGLIELKGLPL